MSLDEGFRFGGNIIRSHLRKIKKTLSLLPTATEGPARTACRSEDPQRFQETWETQTQLLFCLRFSLTAQIVLLTDAWLSKADREMCHKSFCLWRQHERVVKFITLVRQECVDTISRRILKCSLAINNQLGTFRQCLKAVSWFKSHSLFYMRCIIFLYWVIEATLQSNWINVSNIHVLNIYLLKCKLRMTTFFFIRDFKMCHGMRNCTFDENSLKTNALKSIH